MAKMTNKRFKIDHHLMQGSFNSNLLTRIEEDTFMPGTVCDTERYILELARDGGWAETMSWIQEFFYDNYRKPAILEGLLFALSHIKYDLMEPKSGGVLIAMAAISHPDDGVRDMAVQVFENWNSLKFFPLLSSLGDRFPEQREYINKVLVAIMDNGTDY
jgi:hypothetical protein